MDRHQSLSPQEWESIIDDISSGADVRRQRWRHIMPSLIEIAVAAAVHRRDLPSHLRHQIIIFIEEQHHIIAEPPAAALTPLIDALRSTGTGALRDHLMTATTAVAVAALDSPLGPAAASSLETLVEMLLNVINRPNHGPDRQSRALACECLRELEAAFPCLLSDVVGHLWELARLERTHAVQNYLLVVAEVVHNVVRFGLLSLHSSILSTSVPLVPFNAPKSVFSASLDRTAVPSEINLREVKRVLAFLWERPQAMTITGIMELALILTGIGDVLEQYVPTIGSLLKVQFWSLIYCYDPILCHSVLVLHSRFSDAFVGEDEREIARRLALVTKELYQPLVFRLLTVHWLLGSPRLSMEIDSSGPLVSSFYPAVFDPLALKAKKLDALVCFASSLDVLDVEKKGKEDGDHKEQILKFFENGLVCVSAFKWLPPWSTETSVAFRTLHKFLVGVMPHHDEKSKFDVLMSESTVFSRLQTILVSLALEHGALVPVISTFIDQLLGCKVHQHVGERLLQELDKYLLPKLGMDYRLASYFPIFERIAKSETIPPRGLLLLLTRHIISLSEKHGPDGGLRLWSQGAKVLGICRMVLKHHHSSRVFQPLSHLLALICQFFPDLDVRDRARIYLRMLLCIPGKKLRRLLNLGEQPLGVSPASAGSLFQVSSPHHSDDLKKLSNVSSYIFLERATPLLVKQSWALTVPNMNTEISNETSQFDGIKDTPPSTSADIERENNVNLERITAPKALLVTDSDVAEVVGMLRRHFSCIPDYRYMPAIKIKITCQLRFDSESFRHVWEDGSSALSAEDVDSLPAMYATTITFSSTSNYGSILPYRVPFLLGEPPKSNYEIVPADNSHEENSNYHALVMVELEPLEPMPGLIDVSVKANAENGQIISGKLQNIAVGIEDMFLKVIIPVDVEVDEVPEYNFRLFHALWESCGNPASTGRETFPLSGGKGIAAIYGTRSVKLLEVIPCLVINAVEKHLSSFVVGVVGDPLINAVKNNGVIKDVIWQDDNDNSDAHDKVSAIVPYSENLGLQLPYIEDERDAEYAPVIRKKSMGIFLILIFLPPRFHLLFQMEVGSSSTLVRLRTDHWPCLAYIDEYLECLFLK